MSRMKLETPQKITAGSGCAVSGARRPFGCQSGRALSSGYLFIFFCVYAIVKAAANVCLAGLD